VWSRQTILLSAATAPEDRRIQSGGSPTGRNNRVRKVDASTGIISTIAGIGIPGESGDGGPAVNAEIIAPSGVGIDDDGIVYISGSRRIRRVGPLFSLVDALTEIVTDLDLPAGLENSLISKLDTALKGLEDVNENNDVAAINALQAFINSVAAQQGEKISEALADALIGEANQIIALLNGA